jgi:type I restriction enzyme, S subunit
VSGIPLGWQLVELGEICERIVDGSHNPPRASEVGKPMLSARNIADFTINFDDYRLISDVDFELEHSRTQVSTGDVLLTIVGTIGRTAVVPQKIQKFALQRSVAVVKPLGVDSRYVAYFLSSPETQRWLQDNAKGTAQKGVYLKTLGTLPLKVAPENEQTRIVAKLEELLSDLDAGVAELKAAQKKLAQYRQSLLKAAVEGALTAEWRVKHKPTETGAQLLERILKERRTRWEAKQLAKFAEQGKTPPKDWQKKYPESVQPDTTDLPELPEGWVWTSVDDLCDSVRNGLSKTPNTDQRGFPIFKINAVRPMAVNFEAIKHIEISESEAADYWVETGDVLATRYNGSVDLLGVFGMVKAVPQRTLHPDKLIRMKPMTGMGLGAWLEVCGNIGVSRKHLVSRVKTTAGQTGISGDDLKKTPIPVPPADEQAAAIALLNDRLEGINELVMPTELALKQSTAQRQNILRAAFAGELVPHDPDDEPASVLLERIRAERVVVKKPRGRKTKELA